MGYNIFQDNHIALSQGIILGINRFYPRSILTRYLSPPFLKGDLGGFSKGCKIPAAIFEKVSPNFEP